MKRNNIAFFNLFNFTHCHFLLTNCNVNRFVHLIYFHFHFRRILLRLSEECSTIFSDVNLSIISSTDKNGIPIRTVVFQKSVFIFTLSNEMISLAVVIFSAFGSVSVVTNFGSIATTLSNDCSKFYKEARIYYQALKLKRC